MPLLRRRVGNAGDACIGIILRQPQRERTPPAAEFENVLSIGQLRAFASELEHRFLRDIELRRQIPAGDRAAFAEFLEAIKTVFDTPIK